MGPAVGELRGTKAKLVVVFFGGQEDRSEAQSCRLGARGGRWPVGMKTDGNGQEKTLTVSVSVFPIPNGNENGIAGNENKRDKSGSLKAEKYERDMPVTVR